MVKKMRWKIGFVLSLVPTLSLYYLIASALIGFSASAPFIFGLIFCIIFLGLPFLTVTSLSVFFGLKAFAKEERGTIKTMERVFLAAFLVFLILSVIEGWVILPNEEEKIPITVPERNWHITATFVDNLGIGRTTDTFAVKEDHWRIRYIINATEKDDKRYCSFNAVVKTIDHQNVGWKYGVCTQETYEFIEDMSFAAAGEYYIILTTKDVRSWKIVVEECESASNQR
jgi:hypothetical protein